MSRLIFKYGNGKSTDLCQTDYNYKEQGAKTIVLNADSNKTIISKFEGDSILKRKVDDTIKDRLFEQLFQYKKKSIVTIFIDNAHLLTENQVFELFLGANAFDIEVHLYEDIINDGIMTLGTKRALELSSEIDKINGNVNNSHRPNLQFYYGAMNSSKSAKLLIKAKKLEVQGFKVFTIKPRFDREELYIKSRIGIKRKVDLVIDDERLNTLGSTLDDMGVNYLFVDECQFLTERQIVDLYNINRKFYIPIECYGLKTDFLTNTFNGSKKLMELADELIKLKTICNCSAYPKDATFNARKDKYGNYVKEGDQLVIDSGNYSSICSKCYIEKVLDYNLSDKEKVMKKLYK